MNKYEQAINYLEDNKCDQKQGESYQEQHNKVLSLAIKAMERKIPKVALETQEFIEITYICPKCNRLNGYGFNFCFNCGQAIITREEYL